jgi:hypothetical protein
VPTRPEAGAGIGWHDAASIHPEEHLLVLLWNGRTYRLGSFDLDGSGSVSPDIPGEPTYWPLMPTPWACLPSPPAWSRGLGETLGCCRKRLSRWPSYRQPRLPDAQVSACPTPPSTIVTLGKRCI